MQQLTFLLFFIVVSLASASQPRTSKVQAIQAGTYYLIGIDTGWANSSAYSQGLKVIDRFYVPDVFSYSKIEAEIDITNGEEEGYIYDFTITASVFDRDTGRRIRAASKRVSLETGKGKTLTAYPYIPYEFDAENDKPVCFTTLELVEIPLVKLGNDVRSLKIVSAKSIDDMRNGLKISGDLLLFEWDNFISLKPTPQQLENYRTAKGK